MLTLGQYLEIGDVGRQGVSQSQMARPTVLHRKTIRKYLRKSTGPPLKRQRRAAVAASSGPTPTISESARRRDARMPLS